MKNTFLKTWMPVKKATDKKIISLFAIFHIDNNMVIIPHVPPVPNTGNLFVDFEMTIDDTKPKDPKQWIVLNPEAELADDWDTLPPNHMSAITLVCADGTTEDSGSVNTGGAPIL